MPAKIELDVSTVATALKDHAGVYQKACKKLGIHRHTLARFVNDNKELKELSDTLRLNFVEDMLDTCIDVFKKLVDKVDTDPAHAFKSAVYYCNNKGRSRGFAHPDADKAGEKMTTAQALALAGMIEEEKQKFLAIAAGKTGMAKKIKRRKARPCLKK